MAKSTGLTGLTYRYKCYRAYISEAPEHYQSIFNKYGVPSSSQPPSLSEDLIERVMKRTLPEMWNGTRSKIKAGKANG